MRRLLPFLCSLVFLGLGCMQTQAPLIFQTDTTTRVPLLPGILAPTEMTDKQIHIKTAKGDIVFSLFPDEAPLAVSNMVWLTQHHFYDGVIFHRVEPGFVIQGGDPLGRGNGGPGWRFVDEPVKRSYTRGIVAMANAGPNTNGSQFFIMLGDTPLPPSYTIFGEVTSGMDIVDQIRPGDVMQTVTVESTK